jgi:hypothetical protein
MVFASSTSRVRRTPPVETVETKRRPVPASAVPAAPSPGSSATNRVTSACATARCRAISSSRRVVRPAFNPLLIG